MIVQFARAAVEFVREMRVFGPNGTKTEMRKKNQMVQIRIYACARDRIGATATPNRSITHSDSVYFVQSDVSDDRIQCVHQYAFATSHNGHVDRIHFRKPQ